MCVVCVCICVVRCGSWSSSLPSLNQATPSSSRRLTCVRICALFDWTPHGRDEEVPCRLAVADETERCAVNVGETRRARMKWAERGMVQCQRQFKRHTSHPRARVVVVGQTRTRPRKGQPPPARPPARAGRHSPSRCLRDSYTLPLQIFPQPLIVLRQPSQLQFATFVRACTDTGGGGSVREGQRREHNRARTGHARH